MIGIYKFTNKFNGQSYIGQSIHIEQRYKEHLNEIQNTRLQTKWYNAVRKYGIENFTFEILEECEPNQLNEREIYWISFYDSFNNGYNSTPGGQEKVFNPQNIYDLWDQGFSSIEISKKLGIGTTSVYNNLIVYKNYSKHEAKKRGGQLAAKNNNIDTKIYQYDLNGNFIKEWNSCKEVTNQLGYNAALLGKCKNEIRQSAYNYQWKSYKKDKIEPYIANSRKPKEVIQYDLDMNEIARYPSIAEAGRQTHTDSSLIGRVCKNGNKASGFYWKYADK